MSQILAIRTVVKNSKLKQERKIKPTARINKHIELQKNSLDFKTKRTEYERRYREKNAVNIAKYQKKYRKEHKKELAKKQHERYQSNPDDYQKRMKEYYKNNKSDILEHVRKYDEARKNDPEYRAKKAKKHRLYKQQHKDDPDFKAKNAEYQRRYKKKHAVKIAERAKKYRKKHREEMAKKQCETCQSNTDACLKRVHKYHDVKNNDPEYRAKKAEYKRKYRKKNATKIAEYQKKYREKHRKEITKKQREKYRSDPDIYRKYMKKYYKNKKAKIKNVNQTQSSGPNRHL